MKSKQWYIIGAIAVVLLIVLGLYIYISRASADTIEAVKGTKVQLVNASGEKITQAVPLEIDFTGTVRKCNRVSFGVFNVTKCHDGVDTFPVMVQTANDGVFYLGTFSYRPLTKDEQNQAISAILQDQAGGKLSDADLARFIAWLSGVKDTPDFNQRQSKIKEKITSAKSNKDLRPTISALGLLGTLTPAGNNNLDTLAHRLAISTTVYSRFEHSFNLQYANVSVKGDLYNSDTVKVSFITSEYQPQVNLTTNLNKDVANACKLAQ